ncbi:hypothetical protein BKA83DRAFT_670563 [Pisolithus microcarpus]|nr:hypothetical protein BKA83DRAFT_670563 [Pisolithus microcarpus]
MATAHHTSHRASLLNGLRTGGVRATSMSAPHTAAPGASFNIPRFVSTSFQQSPFDDEDLDQVGELSTQHLRIPNSNGLSGAGSFTRALDSSNNGFVRQRVASQKGLNPNSVPFSPAYSQEVQQPVSSADAQLHAYQQMQLMQLEILRLQNAQMQRNQQVQAVVLAEALRQKAKRSVSGLNSATMTAPTTSSFDIGPNPPARRPCQAELLKAQLGISGTSPQEKIPMTATAGGRYGARSAASTIAFPSALQAPESCSPPRQTFVHGGALYRSSSPLSDTADEENVPSKSDAATSWRRGSTTNSVLSGLRTTSTASLRVKITPPPGERLSPPPTGSTLGRLRPRPLSFISTGIRGVPTVTIDDDTVSPASSASLSIPLTPSSSHDMTFLSPREEAAKKLYEGLGVGRPTPSVISNPPSALQQRLTSQPIRQPRGPPSGSDELGPKNFASRIRRRAIGGLNVLMDARERRESIEVY